MNKISHLILCSTVCASFLCGQGLPEYGILVNNSPLHTDTSFSEATRNLVFTGEKVKILNTSNSWHEDDSQKQLFPWWLVESQEGEKGWVFGDALAVSERRETLPTGLQAHHGNLINFGRGFEKGNMWFGVIAGSDVPSGNTILPERYLETYLVISNQGYESVFMPLSGESTFGKTVIEYLDVIETTGDDRPEILVQKISKGVENETSSTWVELYSFQGGNFQKVFGEVIEDKTNNEMHLEFGKGSIQSTQLAETSGSFNIYSQTWFWNPGKRSFEILYPEKRYFLKAESARSILHFTDKPYGFLRGEISKGEQFYILGFQKKTDTVFAEILTSSGQKGFVPWKDCEIKNFSHISWLNNRLKEKSISGPVFSKL